MVTKQLKYLKCLYVLNTETPKSIPYLGADDVIDEVVTLLARLENDRQETEIAHQREKERVVRLANKIDSHCQRRITELPAVVQKGKWSRLGYILGVNS